MLIITSIDEIVLSFRLFELMKDLRGEVASDNFLGEKELTCHPVTSMFS